MVVGSPEPHGPNRTQGRDGHYAIQLGFALGQFVKLPSKFPVKLDVDLKNEKLERSNLLIIGGPRTNLVASELNPSLSVRFSEESFWGSIVDEKGGGTSRESEALIVKVRNPWNERARCVLAAGLSGAATKAAVIGMTNFADQVLEGYEGGDFAVGPQRHRPGRGRQGGQRGGPAPHRRNHRIILIMIASWAVQAQLFVIGIQVSGQDQRVRT